MSSFEPMLETDGLASEIRGRMVLAPVTAKLAAGGQLLVIGPSGSGKTTFLHLIAGLARPTGGWVKVAGADVATMPARHRDRWRGKNLGLIFQVSHLVAALNVLDNLRLPGLLVGVQADDAELRSLLQTVGLLDRGRGFPAELSQGERQRVAIARALVNRPTLLLADEPTSALDDANTATVMGLLQRQAREREITLVVATHDARLLPYFPERLVLGGSP